MSAPLNRPRLTARVQEDVRCPLCHDDLTSERSDTGWCVACSAEHHVECWGELGRCATCGEEQLR